MSEMKSWYRIALLNLLVLTLLGLVLRYKINFPLEFIEQKKLLHAHSHFAFSGWISFLLQVSIVGFFTSDYSKSPKVWNRFFVLSTIVNYAMIISFSWKGYAGISIVLSTMSLWLSYYFVYRILKVFPRDRLVSNLFIKASLFFLVLSSIGPYALAYIIASKDPHQYWYHNALYFFLHFQYNGWFTFAILGFLVRKLEQSAAFNYTTANSFFRLLLLTCIPAYFLTVLWYKRGDVITAINITTVLFQALSLVFLGRLLLSNFTSAFRVMPLACRVLYAVSIAAFVLKVLLQFFSAHPQLGQLAFSFRPIIIGYLHLIFLVFVSLYLLALLAEHDIISLAKPSAKAGLMIFSGAVIINEILLAVQGLASIYYFYISWAQLALFINTILLVAGALLMYTSSKQTITPINKINYGNL